MLVRPRNGISSASWAEAGNGGMMPLSPSPYICFAHLDRTRGVAEFTATNAAAATTATATAIAVFKLTSSRSDTHTANTVTAQQEAEQEPRTERASAS